MTLLDAEHHELALQAVVRRHGEPAQPPRVPGLGAGVLDGGTDGRERGLRVLHDVCEEEERARAARARRGSWKRSTGTAVP